MEKLLYLTFFLGGQTLTQAPVVFQEVLRTFFDTSRSIGVLPLGVPLPLVLDRVVDLHWWTFLLTHTVIIKILAGLK